MFGFVMKFGRMMAFLGGGDRFVVFALGEGGTAERESQRDENDADCSEFHFFTLSTTIRVFRTPPVTLPRLLFGPERTHSATGKALKHK